MRLNTLSLFAGIGGIELGLERAGMTTVGQVEIDPYCHVIRTVRPRYVLLENVSALVRDRDAFGCVLGDLHALGFDAEWATLRASDFGAPHNRERVYIVAHAASLNGDARDRVGARRDGRSPIAARGLSGMDLATRGESARAWLASEPRVERLVDGVPSQSLRLKCGGNAVVPAVAEHIGRLIVEDAEWRGSEVAA